MARMAGAVEVDLEGSLASSKSSRPAVRPKWPWRRRDTFTWRPPTTASTYVAKLREEYHGRAVITAYIAGGAESATMAVLRRCHPGALQQPALKAPDRKAAVLRDPVARERARSFWPGDPLPSPSSSSSNASPCSAAGPARGSPRGSPRASPRRRPSPRRRAPKRPAAEPPRPPAPPPRPPPQQQPPQQQPPQQQSAPEAGAGGPQPQEPRRIMEWPTRCWALAQRFRPPSKRAAPAAAPGRQERTDGFGGSFGGFFRSHSPASPRPPPRPPSQQSQRGPAAGRGAEAADPRRALARGEGAGREAVDAAEHAERAILCGKMVATDFFAAEAERVRRVRSIRLSPRRGLTTAKRISIGGEQFAYTSPRQAARLQTQLRLIAGDRSQSSPFIVVVS